MGDGTAHRCVLYCRQSKAAPGERDADASLSLASQAQRMREHCAREGWTVVEEIRDHDISGERWNRPGLQRVLQRVEQGGVDAVLVFALNRLSRKASHVFRIADALEDRGVALVSVTESGLDNVLMLAVLSGKAQHDQTQLREHIRSNLASRAGRGLHHGRAPYGYRVPPGTDRATRRLEIVPEDAETVRRIFAMRAEGMGMIAIANRLNAAGIPSKQGTTWGHASVRQLLKNPTYAGYVRHRGQIAGDADPANTPPIIDRALWQQVQRLWHHGRTTPAQAEQVTWIQGMVDHACGAKMWIVASGTVDGSTRRKPYFTCGLHAQPAAQRCRAPRAQIRAEPVERAAARCLVADLANLPPSLDDALAAHAAALGKPDAIARRTELERQRDHLRASIGRAEELVISGLRDAAWFREQDARLQADLAAVDAELAALTDVPVMADIDPAFQYVRSLRAAVPLMSDDARRQVLLALGRVRWDGSVRIVYAPEYRPLFPSPVVITPRYWPGRDEWIVELDADAS